jgi:nitrate reductase gamma subunit
MAVLFAVPYLSVLILAVAVVLRWVKLARMPLHLRWELYPMALDKSVPHGGSVYEHVDWWQAEKKTNHLGKLKAMLFEVLLLKGVRDHKRSLWLRSYPFHLGLYLLCAFTALLVGGAVAEAGGLHFAPHAAGMAGWLATATKVVGAAGFVLLGAGALGLLMRRLCDPVLRENSSGADFLNLVLFLAHAMLGLWTFALVDGDCLFLRGFVRAVVTFQAPGAMPLPVAAEIVLGCALIAYVPLTHMSHFFTKWFMYHHVRWDDEPNRVGSKIEARVRQQLGHKVGWNAPHIRGGGDKTWVDVATEEGTSK